ncbi:MAG: phage tail protein [Deltaproteobacteria bacterium]|nr:phage tail protein [Deltaproteobacteria bacterium]
MHRIDSKNVLTDEQGRNLFTGGNPHKPEKDEATWLSADWLNAVQEELCSFIESQGLELSKDNHNGLGLAVQKAVQNALIPVNEQLRKLSEEIYGGKKP